MNKKIEDLGHWGRMKLSYLKSYDKEYYKELKADNSLVEYLFQIEIDALEYKKRLAKNFKEHHIKTGHEVYSDLAYESMAEEFVIQDIIQQ